MRNKNIFYFKNINRFVIYYFIQLKVFKLSFICIFESIILFLLEVYLTITFSFTHSLEEKKKIYGEPAQRISDMGLNHSPISIRPNYVLFFVKT